MKVSRIIAFILKIVAVVSVLILLVSVAISGYIYWKQDSLIFASLKIKEGMNYDVPSNFENVFFKTPEGYIYKCWFVKRDNYTTKPTIQYILGNGGYIENYIDTYKELSEKLDVNIFTCSMRGCGTYEGKATEELLYGDAQMYLDYLKKRNLKHIFVHGRSMGGAVAIEMAHKNPEAYTGLIVENTFTNLKHIVSQKKPILYFFILNFDWIVRTKMRNDEKIMAIRMPTLFLISLKDTVVHPNHGINLFNLASSKHKYVFSSAEGTHNDVTVNEKKKFYEDYAAFLKISIKVANKEAETIIPNNTSDVVVTPQQTGRKVNEESQTRLRG